MVRLYLWLVTVHVIRYRSLNSFVSISLNSFGSTSFDIVRVVRFLGGLPILPVRPLAKFQKRKPLASHDESGLTEFQQVFRTNSSENTDF